MVDSNHPMMMTRILHIAQFIFLISMPVALLLLPAGYFDYGKSTCLSVILLDKECMGCGLTRASMHLIHFDFMEAIYHNPLVLIVVPIGIYFWWKAVYQSFAQVKKSLL